MVNRGGKTRNTDRFYFLGLQNHCKWWLSHEIKTFVPWKKSSDKPIKEHIKEQRHHFASEGSYSETMIFPGGMYGCEIWTIKKTDHWRIAAFELWCWRSLLGISWTARRSNQSILKEINCECALERLMLMLKLQYSRHLMWRDDSLEKTLILGKM